MADRSAQIGADPYALSSIPGASGQAGSSTSSALLGTYQALDQQVVTQTYANGFYVVSILGVIGMVLAAFMRSGRPAGYEPRGRRALRWVRR